MIDQRQRLYIFIISLYISFHLKVNTNRSVNLEFETTIIKLQIKNVIKWATFLLRT